ncbi:MAG: F0F1 ATP synthase subunit B [Solobacterium sp.]|jgi:F-type H+-transporting ATPase subunit b|nr:F0F1 ATP synthase subunit B [Solobacterium sp.]MCH4265822.1 F0F1 ATP synthase subunit B [Solobacterium sp.]
MINVDVAEQLFPNWVTMITQLCSTLVLFLLVKKFLWKSIKNWLGKRSDKMQSDLGEAQQAKQDALSDREQASLQLNQAAAKSRDMVDAAVKAANTEKESILAQASKEADAERAKAHEQIEAERLAMYRGMQKEMVNVAMDAAGRLIGEKNGEEMDRQAIDAFVKEASGDDK